MRLLTRVEEVDEILRRPAAIIFKHSTMCPTSAHAHREAQEFHSEHPERELYQVNVIESRAVSDYVAERTAVRHESPQVLLLRDGRVVWHESHMGVTAEAIARALDR